MIDPTHIHFLSGTFIQPHLHKQTHSITSTCVHIYPTTPVSAPTPTPTPTPTPMPKPTPTPTPTPLRPHPHPYNPTHTQPYTNSPAISPPPTLTPTPTPLHQLPYDLTPTPTPTHPHPHTCGRSRGRRKRAGGGVQIVRTATDQGSRGRSSRG